jgi:hypothetical protein
MKIKHVLTVCFATIALVSCLKSKKYEDASTFSFEDFKTFIKLDATTVEFDELIMKPLSFVLSDSLLIMQNIMTENMLYVYNINTKKKVGEYISYGSGPNELLRIKNMQLIDSNLYLADNQRRLIYIYDVHDFHTLTPPVPKHKLKIEDSFSSLAYTDNGYVATIFNPDNKRLVFLNSKGEKEYMAGEYPSYGEEISIIEKTESFLSSILANPKDKRIYLFGMNTDLIEIYDFKGEFIKRLHGPEHFFPQLKEVSLGDGYSKIGYSEDSRFAYINPVIVEDEIYVAYSGNPQKRDEEVATINHILVFDKDGNPVRGYELSKPIVAFAVDSETKYIYATSNIPDFHLVVFKP